ncbi:H-NS family nucleoid-associated regulatory protein [Vibrio anguillarum]|uniref:DNA-binding protein H-NS-like C-terminal domain-containing protein n=2 Tax=Vibrio anguillarum TaxID=55601 RepID=A0AAW4BIM2_VIBAN|nr:H-NS family nucleoid-associated regulatory protein [Vibrio anguillarum]MBF4374367.1 hypothetical protein [Vibrio anguillarum]MBF4436941.1 hypothetical protein [Vibrio anguillarum]
MKELIKLLTTNRGIKQLIKEATLDEMKLISTNVEEGLIEKQIQVEEDAKAEIERKEKIANAVKFLESQGLKIDDLLEEKKIIAKKPSKAKYRFMADGEERLWSGRGKMPEKLKEQVTESNPLDSFEIKD